ncbi:20481_t:CDS:2, partial [Gigaspora rosea]
EKQLLRKKGLRKGLHISEFLTKTIRRLKDKKGENENWNGEKLLSQVKNAIEIFEQMHPGCIEIWVFDNVTSHTIMIPNALVAARIYLNLYMLSLQLEPKRMKAVLNKRGLWKDGLRANYFLNKHELIQQEIEKNGHK